MPSLLLLSTQSALAAPKGAAEEVSYKASFLAGVPIEDVSRMYLLRDYFGTGENGVLLLRPERRQLSLFRLIDNELRHIKRATPWGFVSAASSYFENGRNKIVVAYDYTKSQSLTYMQGENGQRYKKRLPRAIKIVLYDEELDNEELVYHQKLETADISFLGAFGSDIFLGYLRDESFSRGGWLRRNEKSWKLYREYGGNHQTHIDVRDGLVLTGSPSLDREGTGSEVKLFKDKVPLDLPSLRGVSALSFAQLDEDKDLEILLADGLGNRRIKRTESQLAVLDKVGNSYKRKKIARARKGDKILERVEAVCSGKETRVLTKGWTFFMLYEPSSSWRAVELYRKPAELAQQEIELLPIKCSESELLFALLENKEVRLMRYAFDK